MTTPKYDQSVRIAQYLAKEGHSASTEDLDTLIDLVRAQFLSSADPDFIRDKVLDDWLLSVSASTRDYVAASEAIEAARSDEYAASAMARVVGARIAGAYFGGQTPVDYPRHVREIAWRFDDFPVELEFGDPPQPLDTWSGWLSDFWRDNDNGRDFLPQEVSQILNLRPGGTHHLQETAFMHSVLRRLPDGSSLGHTGPRVADELAFIHRVRARMAMRPLDPAASGWSDQDVVLEAQRLRREGNPRAECLAWC